MDTLRYDHLGAYGYIKPTSPHIDQLARDGVVFKNAVSQAPWTLPAHMTLFTALYPSEHGLDLYSNDRRKWRRLAADTPLLAEVLGRHGFVTVGFTGGGFVRPAFGFSRGFDMYRTDARRLECFHDKVLDWLSRNRDWPFFLFVHFYNCHRHYKPPAPYNELFAPPGSEEIKDCNRNFCKSAEKTGRLPSAAELAYIVSQYDGEIRFADELLGEMFNHLDHSGLADKTLIIFTSDHGEEFFEHGNCDHIKSLYDPLIKVPLILRGPGLPADVQISWPVELKDVPQLVLDYLEIPETLDREDRHILAAVQQGEEPDGSGVAFSEARHKGYEIRDGQWFHSEWRRGIRSMQSDEFKLISSEEGAPLEFYNLGRDPLEKENLLGHAEDRQDGRSRNALHYLRQCLSEKLESMPTYQQGSDRSAGWESALDEETLEQLRTLGYIE